MNAVVGLTVTASLLAGVLVALGGLRQEDRELAGPASEEPTADLSLGAGEYFYEHHRWFAYPYGTRARWVTWWAPDGAGLIDTYAPEEPAADVFDVWMDYSPPHQGRFESGDYERWWAAGPWEDISFLSTDPDELERQLLERSGSEGASPQPTASMGPGHSPSTGPMWRSISDLLEFPNATPELRAALFTVAARIPDVRTRSGVRDPGGRPAISLTLDVGSGTSTLFFDPHSHQLMSTWDVFPEGEVGTILDAGIVGSAGESPSPAQRLYPPARPGSPRS